MPFYENEVTEVRLPAGARADRAKRRKQRRLRRFGTVAVLGLALLAFPFAARSWAWTAGVTPSPDCDGTTFNGSVGNEPGTHTAAVTFAGETKSVTVPAEGGNSFTLHFTSHDGGPWSYQGTWSESSEVETDSGTVAAVTDCTPTETTTPTPTTNPPAEQPPTETTTPVVGPPDQHPTPSGPVEPTPDDSPELGTPPTVNSQPGTLPFTGPALIHVELVLMAVLFAGGALMVLGGRRRYQQLTLVEKAVDRAMHGKPYNGPHEPV